MKDPNASVAIIQQVRPHMHARLLPASMTLGECLVLLFLLISLGPFEAALMAVRVHQQFHKLRAIVLTLRILFAGGVLKCSQGDFLQMIQPLK